MMEQVGYWAVVQPIRDKVSIYGTPEDFERQFAGLNPIQQNLFAITWCRSEIGNGGFHQFFINPTGILAPEAVVGFRAIGLPGCATLLEEAMAFFESPYPREQSEREDALAEIVGETRQERDPFYSLDDEFYQLCSVENGGFETAAETYAARSVA